MTHPTPSLAVVTHALDRETELAHALAAALAAQRAGVARNDTAAVEAAADELARVLRALDESHAARRALVRSFAGEDDALDRLATGDDPAAAALRDARARLAQALERASREARRQQQVLRGALATGEQLLLGLFQACAPSAGLYEVTGSRTAGAAPQGVLVDRTV